MSEFLRSLFSEENVFRVIVFKASDAHEREMPFPPTGLPVFCEQQRIRTSALTNRHGIIVLIYWQVELLENSVRQFVPHSDFWAGRLSGWFVFYSWSGLYQKYHGVNLKPFCENLQLVVDFIYLLWLLSAYFDQSLWERCRNLFHSTLKTFFQNSIFCAFSSCVKLSSTHFSPFT